MMMEAHTTNALVVLETARRGLADVMEQRGQTQDQVRSRHRRGRPISGSLQGNGLFEHGQSVLVDILMSVMLVHLELERRKFGQDARCQACVDEEGESLTWRRAHDELDELVTDPLRRHDLQR